MEAEAKYEYEDDKRMQELYLVDVEMYLSDEATDDGVLAEIEGQYMRDSEIWAVNLLNQFMDVLENLSLVDPDENSSEGST